MPKVMKISRITYAVDSEDKENSPFMLIAQRGDTFEVWSNEQENHRADAVINALSSEKFASDQQGRMAAIYFGLGSYFNLSEENISDRLLAEMTKGWHKGKIDQRQIDLLNQPVKPRKKAPRSVVMRTLGKDE